METGKTAIQFFRRSPEINPGISTVPFAEIKDQLSSIYGEANDECCNHDVQLPDLLSEEELTTILDHLIEKVWKEKGMPKTLSSDVIRYYAEQLWHGLIDGYGEDLLSVETDTPDEVMLTKLQESVWHFSAAKNYTQLRQMSEALIGPDGKLVEFAEFKRQANAINNIHKDVWLKTEYDLAVANGQMSSRWVDAQANKELFPNLEYSAVMDGRTTVTCIDLNGVVRPVDDPFWNTWYPPNHFKCRSDVTQNADDYITPLSEIVYPENIPQMFKRNMAAEGMAFPDGHPYYIDNPDGVKSTASKLMKKYGQ